MTDPDELAEALSVAQSQQQTADDGDMSWDGRIAESPSGPPIVWRGTRMRGRFVALNYETADPQSRERVENVSTLSNIGQRLLPQARQFIDRNFTTPTGGIQNSPTMNSSIRSVLANFAPDTYTNADELRGRSSQMVGTNWQPGTTGMMNTPTEMEQIRQRVPSPTNLGRANMRIYLQMAEDIAVQREAVAAMRDWLTRSTNLDGFDADFARSEPEIRAAARRAAYEDTLVMEAAAGGRQQQSQQQRAQRILIDEYGNQVTR